MTAENLTKFQHCNFLNVENASIKNMATFNDHKDYICAISRDDGSVDIWIYDIDNNYWYQTVTIAGSDSMVYLCMVWLDRNTLLLGGTSSDLCVIHFKKKVSKKFVNCGGSGCVWSMSIHQKRHLVAIGTDDSCVVLFDIDQSNIIFKHVVDKCMGKVLCIDWHPIENIIACGTENSRVYLFNALTKECIGTLNADKILGVHAILWKILLLNDMTVVVGDSFGKIQFYDGKFGTLTQSFRSHKAAILSLASSKSNNNVIFASGVENKIAAFCQSNDNIWTHGLEYRFHHNDIVCLELITNDYLMSASMDGSCNMYHIDHEKLNLLHSFGLFSKMLKITITEDYILFSKKNVIHLYMHKSSDSKELADSYPQKLLELKIRGDYHIQDLFITPSGNYICCTTQYNISCYYLELMAEKDNTHNITNIDICHNMKPFVTHALFNTLDRCNEALLFYSTKKYIIVQLVNFSSKSCSKYKLKNDITYGPFCEFNSNISPNDKILGILIPLNHSGNPQISLYSTDDFQLLNSVDMTHQLITAFTLANDRLVYSTITSQIFQYRFIHKEKLCDIKFVSVYQLDNSKSIQISKIAIDNNSTDIICVTNYILYKIKHYLKNNTQHKLNNKSKCDTVTDKCIFGNSSVKSVLFKNRLLEVKQLNNNSFVVISRRFEDITMEQLPAFKRKRFANA